MLGDAIEQALTKVGITADRVERWLGRPCACKARRDKLNAIDAWARRVLSGKTEQAEEHLNKLTEEQT